MEAARRVIDEGGLDLGEARDLREGLRAIVRGFHGCEISPFPYYLTEVNLLLQVSRLLGRLREVGEEPSTFTLGVVHTDSLGARRGPGESFRELEPRQRADAALLASDERYGIVPLDAAKEPRFAQIRRNEVFDLIIGNPPYVFESGNKVLFDRLRALAGWRDVYRGKSDYLYYFLAMAAEKLAPRRAAVCHHARRVDERGQRGLATRADRIEPAPRRALPLREYATLRHRAAGARRAFRHDAADGRERHPRRDEGTGTRAASSARRAARGRSRSGARAHGGPGGTHPAEGRPARSDGLTRRWPCRPGEGDLGARCRAGRAALDAAMAGQARAARRRGTRRGPPPSPPRRAGVRGRAPRRALGGRPGHPNGC